MYSGEDSQADLHSRKLSPVASPRLPNERNPLSTCDQYKTTPANAGAACHTRSANDSADGAAEIGAAIRHRQHDHLGADADPRIEIRDVLVGEAEAARGNTGADRLRRIGAVVRPKSSF